MKKKEDNYKDLDFLHNTFKKNVEVELKMKHDKKVNYQSWKQGLDQQRDQIRKQKETEFIASKKPEDHLMGSLIKQDEKFLQDLSKLKTQKVRDDLLAQIQENTKTMEQNHITEMQ